MKKDFGIQGSYVVAIFFKVRNLTMTANYDTNNF